MDLPHRDEGVICSWGTYALSMDREVVEMVRFV